MLWASARRVLRTVLSLALASTLLASVVKLARHDSYSVAGEELKTLSVILPRRSAAAAAGRLAHPTSTVIQSDSCGPTRSHGSAVPRLSATAEMWFWITSGLCR